MANTITQGHDLAPRIIRVAALLAERFQNPDVAAYGRSRGGARHRPGRYIVAPSYPRREQFWFSVGRALTAAYVGRGCPTEYERAVRRDIEAARAAIANGNPRCSMNAPLASNTHAEQEVALCAELQSWCAAQGLQCASADDMLCSDDLTPEQRQWLTNYCARWDAWAERGRAATDPQEWTTYRTACGRGRITYHAEWSASMPWASYWDGTAGRHFATVEAAAMYFRDKHGARLVA